MSYDSGPAEPGFRELFRGSQNRQALCTLTIIAWVACCDGTISSKERELLKRIAEGNEETPGELSAALEAARGGRAEDLEVACRYLRSHASRGAKRLLAQLAITMAVQDGRLSISENLVLQFLADLMGISPRAFNKLFEKTAGRPFPEAGDPSSVEWWRQRQAGIQASPPADNWRVGGPSRAGAPDLTKATAMTRGEALEVLGLDPSATADTMRGAYRRLAKKRHPDRFAPLGAAAVATATVAFERLREAYDLLSNPGVVPEQAVAAPEAAPVRTRAPGTAGRVPAGQKMRA